MKLVVGIVCFLFSVFVHGQTLFLPGSKAYTISQRNKIVGLLDTYHSSSLGGDLFIYPSDIEDARVYPRDKQYLQEIRFGSPKRVNKTKKVLSDSVSGFFRYENVEEQEVRNPRKPVFGLFYLQEANFFQVDKETVSLRVNPILKLSYGRNTKDNTNVINNQRGVELYGALYERLYFYTNIIESQSNFLPHVEARIKKYSAIPGNGLYKPFKSRVLGSFSGWDYLNASGFIGYKLVPSVAMELGHGRHFIGDGIRSLFLSDYAHNSFYLKLRAKFWRLNYQSIFNELAPMSGRQIPGDNLIPKKYAATHILTYHINKNIELGLFESVVFNRENHFEFQYLNPVILYRAVEHFLGSSDNALVGLSARVNTFQTAQVYGQLLFDEFNLKELRAGNGWWANKYGYQFGVKYFDAFTIPFLDFQYEYNRVRPYTYSHRGSVSTELRQSYSSYTHYNQPLAHPLGANFVEHIIQASYRPIEPLTISGRLMIARTGLDVDSTSYGQDVLVSTDFKRAENGNIQGQGDNTRIQQFDVNASYELLYNLYLDAHLQIRNQISESGKNDFKSTYIGLGIRYNFIPRKIDY